MPITADPPGSAAKGVGEIALLSVYLFINSLFVYKYSVRWTDHFLLATALYIVFAAGGLALMFNSGQVLRRIAQSSGGYWLAVGGLLAVVSLVMVVVPADTVQVSRAASIDQWWDRLLAGQYPYGGDLQPSGLPGLYLLALPFYLVREFGLLSIISLGILAEIVRRTGSGGGTGALGAVVLLAVSPAFLWELAVRSDLGANVALALAWGLLALNPRVATSTGRLLWIGALGGVLVASRIIVWIPLALFLVVLFRRNARACLRVSAGMLISSVLITHLFWLWDPIAFVMKGPYAVQGQYLPFWIGAAGLLCLAVLMTSVRTLQGSLIAGGLLMFALVAVPFVYDGLREGFTVMILTDNFDISHFCLSLPAVVLALFLPHTPREQTRAVDNGG
jgi:hypothetical protein